MCTSVHVYIISLMKREEIVRVNPRVVELGIIIMVIEKNKHPRYNPQRKYKLVQQSKSYMEFRNLESK